MSGWHQRPEGNVVVEGRSRRSLGHTKRPSSIFSDHLRRLLFHMDLHLLQTSQIQFLIAKGGSLLCICFAIRGWQRFSTWAGYGETPPEGHCNLKKAAMLSFACSQSGSEQSEICWLAHANIPAVIICILTLLCWSAMRLQGPWCNCSAAPRHSDFNILWIFQIVWYWISPVVTHTLVIIHRRMTGMGAKREASHCCSCSLPWLLRTD